MKLRTKIASALGVVALALTGVAAVSVNSSASAASAATNPQLAPKAGVGAAAATPNQCYLDRQASSAGYHQALTNNVAYTLPNVATWQTLKCTTSTFTVPRGQSAGVRLGYSGEFDASGPAGNTGWVQGRFRVVSLTSGGSGLVPVPNNTDRGDSFALDSSSGQYYDWSAHTLVQESRATCAANAASSVCTFRVYVEGMLTAGADYFWYDDTTVTVDTTNSATYGTPVRTSVTP